MLTIQSVLMCHMLTDNGQSYYEYVYLKSGTSL